jgi:hypothetical protein
LTLGDAELITGAAAAHLVVSELGYVDHAFVASCNNAISFRTVVACTATVANDIELGLIVQTEVGMQSPHGGC